MVRSLVGAGRPATQEMRPAHMPMHGLAPGGQLIGIDPFVQIEPVTHTPARQWTKPCSDVTLQSQIDRSLNTTDKTSGRLPALMISPAPDVHQAPGCVRLGYQQFEGLERARVWIGHRRIDFVAGGVKVEPSPSHNRDVKAAETVGAHELTDLLVNQCGVLVKRFRVVIANQVIPHDQLRNEGVFAALPTPFSSEVLQKAVCTVVRMGLDYDRACMPIQLGVLARGDERPGARLRAREAKRPGRIAGIVHFRGVCIAAGRVGELHRGHDVKCIAVPTGVGDAPLQATRPLSALQLSQVRCT